MIKVANLRCEYQQNPLGIGVREPRLSWQLVSDQRGVVQSAYQICVEDDNGTLWECGKVESADIQLPYAGPALRSGQRCRWRVRVWDGADEPSEWSDYACWEMGLLSCDDWQAAWIRPLEESTLTPPSPLLRRDFTIEKPVARARLYVTALGLYECILNGQRVGCDLLTPGWTSYANRLLVQTYNVIDLLHDGTNAIGVTLGDGWYRGRLGWEDHHHHYGDRVALLLQLTITHTDGTVAHIVSDKTWRSRTGAIRFSSIYDGEVYDARLEPIGWSVAGFDDAEWLPVEVLDESKESLVAWPGPYVRHKEIARADMPVGRADMPVGRADMPVGRADMPVARADMPTLALREISRIENHTVRFDCGENIVGRVRLRVSGTAGTTLTLRHAEVLNPDGSLYTDNLRSAKATVRYTLRGNGVETYEPHFSFQGFRYVEVRAEEALTADPLILAEGADMPPLKLGEGSAGLGLASESALLTIHQIEAVVIYSDLETTGEFACSNELLNQLQRNIVRSQKGNFIDVPTDCPQRDERMGWAGDVQLFAPTAIFNMHVARFFTKWVRDLAADQKENGAYPLYSPILPPKEKNSHEEPIEKTPLQVEQNYAVAGWADAGIIVPWTLYLYYGDRRILGEQYDSMAAWVANIEQKTGDGLIWEGWFQFGDWLSFNAHTPNTLVATAYFAHSADLMSRIALVLGKSADAEHYRTLYERIKSAFINRFVQPDGTVATGSQTAQVLSLAFDLLPPDLRPAAAHILVADIRARNNHLSTGVLGSPLLLHTLSENGYLDVAYDLLLQDTCPSWLYPITMGATSIWERWDSILPNGSFYDPSMNSFNHYISGAIGHWLYRVIGGIEIGASAYKKIVIGPQPGGELTWARTTYQSSYGLIAVYWRIDGSTFHLDLSIPPNTTAQVHLPTSEADQVTEQNTPLSCTQGIHQIEPNGTSVVATIGSGDYHFTMPYTPIASHPSPPPNTAHREPRLSACVAIGDLLNDKAAMSLLKKYLPLSQPMVAEALKVSATMSLYQITEWAPHIISLELAQTIDAELRQI